ncbi:MAG: hypothetical protein QMD99_25990, partial [Rhizobiaceae bacterium]|nr:hypothetical protein [Rhizobiaceae bacterium]
EFFQAASGTTESNPSQATILLTGHSLPLGTSIRGSGSRAWLAIYQLTSPGAMIAASTLTSRALAPIEQAVAHWRGFVNARQARRRLESVLEKFADDHGPTPLPAPNQRLEVAGLAAVAPGSNVAIVRDVSFKVLAGQGVAVI